MRASIRVGRLLYWIGGFVSLSILALWLISLRFGDNLYFRGARSLFAIDNGMLTSVVLIPPGDPSLHRHQYWDVPLSRALGLGRLLDELSWSSSPAVYIGLSRPEFSRTVWRNGVSYRMSLPLWLMLIAVALPTWFLWRRDRRRIPPGHCQRCGYNLTGNTTGVCPECGQRLRTRPGPASQAHDTGA